MFHKVKLILFVLASMVSSQVFAIGLGEIKLKTPLNEPLDAEIELLQVNNLSENEILVNLAPKEDFEAAGVERAFFLTSLRFSLELDNETGPIVRVSTETPVREPYLNFLLEIQWPNGRLLREYTLLMDLPVYADEHSSARAIRGTETRMAPPPAKPEPEPLDIAELEAELQALETTSVTARPPAPPAYAEAEETAVAETVIETEDVPEPPVEELGYEEAPVEEAPVEEAAPVEMVEEQVVEPEPMPAVEPEPQPTYESSIPVYSSSYSEGEYGPVQAGDNLWTIASRHRPDAGVSVQQTMLAIQRLNPEAFIDGNINLLKKGRVLRMPTRDQITDITNREAFSEVRRQNIEWSGDPDGRKAPEAEQLDATTREVDFSETVVDEEEGHLKLSVPGESDGSMAGKGSGLEEGSTEALQNELVISMEELDRHKREEREISGAISELDDQIETMEQMLEVRNSELEALEAAMAGQVSDGIPVEDTALEEEVVDTESVYEEPVEVTDEVVVEETVVETTPVEPTAIIDETPPAQPEDRGIVGMLMDNLIVIAGAILALLVLVVVALKLRSRGGSSAEEEDELDFDDLLEGADDSDSSSDDEDFSDLDAMFDTDDEDGESAEPAEEEAPAEAETGDVLGEADIYISFGNYDKAESLLKTAIAAEPGRTDLRLKLLEVHAEEQNLQSFDAQYQELSGLGDAGAIERAQELRGKIDGASGVDLPAAGESPAAADDGDFDLDLDGIEDDPSEAIEEDLGLDLDLDLDSSDADTAADDDFDLDLDLSDDGDLSADVSEEPAETDFDLDLSEETEDAATTEDASLDSDLDFDLDLSEDLSEPEPEVAATAEDDFDLDLSGLDEPSEAPTAESPSVSISESPTLQTPALDISETPTAVSPAVNVSEAPTETRPELDLDSVAEEPVPEPVAEPEPAAEEKGPVEDEPTPADTELDEEFDFLADADEAATKLDLARAYIDMGDKDGAKDILEEVLEEGQDAQKQEAQQLLNGL